MSQGHRPDRVGEQIREELSALLSRGAVHDPGIGFITLTRVDVSADLQVAHVYYTTLGDDKARADTARALERATPFFRRHVGSTIRLRRVPEIDFRFDQSIANQDRIEQILRDLHEEEARREKERAAAAPRVASPAEIAVEIRQRQRFVVVSHSRPDGDAIGSAFAMAFALRQLGKQVRVVSSDLPAPPLLAQPGVAEIIVTDRVDDPGDAVIVMECSDLKRTGVAGLEAGFVINVDHHPGNTLYGAMNWIDESAAACGEMVFTLVQALGVPLTPEIATHVYVAILTDTGSFHYSNITPRTFEICRLCMDAGIEPPAIARSIFDSNNLGRLKLFGAVLSRMELDQTGRIALISVDQQLAQDCGGTYEDTEGINNLPLTVKEIVAVAFFKEASADEWRVSLRSKDDVNVNAVAKDFGGGGHRNASGCTVQGTLSGLKALFTTKLTEAIEQAQGPGPQGQGLSQD